MNRPSPITRALPFSMLLFSACGGQQAADSRSPDTVAPEEQPRERTMRASAEIGALDEAKVTAGFRSAQGSLKQCLDEGASRIELIGGEIAFYLKVGSRGEVLHVHAENSTIGDRETELCMFDALRVVSWPAPVGGDVGIARTSFDFDMPNDVRPPLVWDAGRVIDTMSQLDAELQECKHGYEGRFTATVYVDTEGSALSASVTPPDEEGEASIDCLVNVVRSAQYESPGSWPAKVMFTL